MRLLSATIVGSIVCGVGTLLAVRQLEPADPGSAPSYVRVSHLIGESAFGRLDPLHRRFLVTLADKSAQFGPTVSCCFSGPMDWEYMEAFNRAIQGAGSRFQLGSRWSNTATDGGGLSQGDPTTLTYSFVPDGTWIPSGVGEPSGPSDMFAVFDSLYPSTEAWQDLFHQAFARWAELCGITYVYEPGDDGATLRGSNQGILGVRGDVRIGGKYIDGQAGANVLAYNSFPNNGDMVLDTSNTGFYGSTSQNSRNLRNVVAHEHGHGMGLYHVCPIDFVFPKLMEPYFSSQYDGPQHDDIQGAQRHYGDRLEHNDTPATATDLGTLSMGTYTVSDVSMDDNNESDYFKFTVSADSMVSVALRPVGFTYMQGPQTQNCDGGSQYNSLIANNLGVDVRDTNGTTVLASADDFPAGEPETLDNVLLPSGPGTYYVRVFSRSSNTVQLYELDVWVIDLECNQNGVPDAQDIAEGTSEDCNGNEVPDECEIDENSDAPGGPFFCTAGCDPDGNGNGIPDECDLLNNDCNGNSLPDFNEDPVYLVRNSSGAVNPPPVATAPLSQDVHLGDAALLTSFEVTYRSMGTVGGTMTVRFFQGSADDGVVPAYPDGLIAEFDLGGLDVTNGANRKKSLDPSPPFSVPADIWVEVEFVTAGGSFGVVRKSGPPTTGSSHGLIYDRDAQSVSGPEYMNFKLWGVLCFSDCNENGVRDLEDIGAGTSNDCQANSIPDECEPDSDGDGVIDGCENCPNEPALVEPEGPVELVCDDGVDNDCDGLTDEADADDCVVSCTNTCADINGDLSIDLQDFTLFAGCFGQPPATSQDCLCSDFNGDQSINLADFTIFAGLFGQGSTNTPPDCP